MKFLYTLTACLFITTAFAQNKYNISFGPNFIIDHRQDKIHTQGFVQLNNNVATTTAGKIEGNFEGKPKSRFTNHVVNGNKYWYKPAIFVANNKLSIHCGEQEFCFTTNPIDVSSTSEIGFEIDFSGKGSLDKSDPLPGIVWHDWIAVSYKLDDQKFPVNTKNGFVEQIQQQSIAIENAKAFQIEICMRNTGHDEWYTIENIEINETPLMDFDLEEIVVKAKKAKSKATVITCCGIINAEAIEKSNDETEKELVAKKNISNSPTLSIFPNPTSDYLELVDAHKYDLNSIRILDATGKIINITSTYPLDLSSLAAGTYFLSVVEKETKEQLSTAFVVVQP